MISFVFEKEHGSLLADNEIHPFELPSTMISFEMLTPECKEEVRQVLLTQLTVGVNGASYTIHTFTGNKLIKIYGITL